MADEIFSQTIDGQRRVDTRQLAKVLDGGLIEILGRVDSRIKINGMSVVPEEVEFLFKTLPNVKDIRVFGQSTHTGNLLCAEIQLEDDSVTVADLIALAQQRLPVHMIPTRVNLVEAIKRNTAGKIDRSQATEGPLTAVHDNSEAIRKTFEVILSCNIDHSTDFFAAGGNSLLAIRAISEINDRLGISVPLRTFLISRTPEGIANALESEVL
ncbi:phosphopantetheine-binding protein [Arthrobacter sp. R1-13]